MNPVAFDFLGVQIRWYGILIGLGVIIGTILGLREAKRQGIEEDTLLDLLIFAIPISLIGARLYYVIFSWEKYSHNPISALNFRSGGLAIHGGIIAAILTGIVYSKVKKVNFWKLGDIAAPSMILGQAIGRWGNYINQEAYGGPTNLPWGILVNGQRVHPTFLYESLWNFLVFLFLLWYRKDRDKEEGEVFLLYLILYSIARIFIEGLRTDSLMFGPFRVAQLVSLIFILVAGYFFVKVKKTKGKTRI